MLTWALPSCPETPCSLFHENVRFFIYCTTCFRDRAGQPRSAECQGRCGSSWEALEMSSPDFLMIYRLRMKMLM